MWDQSRVAWQFFKGNFIPFWEMYNDNAIVSNGWALINPTKETIVIYKPIDVGSVTVDLTLGHCSVKWFNPRKGDSLQTTSVTGAGPGLSVSLGSSPSDPNLDWVILLRRVISGTPFPTPTPAAPTPPTPAPVFGSITGFTLVNAETDRDIRPLVNNAVIDLTQTGNQLSVRAEYQGSIGSVGFGMNGNANFQTENAAPYALDGNRGSNYFVVTPLGEPGSHTITATPYSSRNKAGDVGTPVTITISTAYFGA